MWHFEEETDEIEDPVLHTKEGGFRAALHWMNEKAFA